MSNSNYNLILTAAVTYTLNGETHQSRVLFDPYNDCTDMEELKQYCIDEVQIEYDEGLINEKPENISVEISDFYEVPIEWANEKDVWKFAKTFAECSYDADVVEAAFDCDVPDIDKAYQGEYNSDEDFAKRIAEELGYMSDTKGWPFTCIDWEAAAKEIMYDYTSSNGHYFIC